MYDKSNSRYRAPSLGLMLADTHLGFKEVPVSSPVLE